MMPLIQLPKWSTSFCIPLSDVLEMKDVCMFMVLQRIFFQFSLMTDLQCIVQFDYQQVVIRKRGLDPSKVLPKRVHEGGL